MSPHSDNSHWGRKSTMTDLSDKTYYEILGVSSEATTEEIREAYKGIARAFHPDSNFYDEIIADKNSAPPDQEKFKKITEAYNTLISEERRKEYDKLFPKGLRDWDEIERFANAPQQNDFTRVSRDDLTGKIYRPRNNTASFRRSTFGMIEPSKMEKEVENALRGRSITPIEPAPARNLLPWFIGLLILGFMAGIGLAYWVVTRN